MKRFTVIVEGKCEPSGQEYIIYAETPAAAKKKAVKRFSQDDCLEYYDYLDIEVKGKNGTKFFTQDI
ncbi:MAG: hypothetical protein LBQ89_08050 [Treponema sp.]|nr:hypothetical protein [Treponema sp.]